MTVTVRDLIDELVQALETQNLDMPLPADAWSLALNFEPKSGNGISTTTVDSVNIVGKPTFLISFTRAHSEKMAIILSAPPGDATT